MVIAVYAKLSVPYVDRRSVSYVSAGKIPGHEDKTHQDTKVYPIPTFTAKRTAYEY
jgi:hypothetical protein